MILEHIKDFGMLAGLAAMIYEAHRFAKHALSLAEEAKGVAMATNTAITEIRIITERLVVITEGLDRRIQNLENEDDVQYYVVSGGANDPS